uniref:calcium-binding and coiled-coil domain-containing protein 2 isoform X2 n=1 Tax=Monopterus albus TaxID=43700 RepID=UPI0009B37A84|nr:calcium-binding and coiled-coil domain-containing protein 2 isoform X2 [Monopterus albus]
MSEEHVKAAKHCQRKRSDSELRRPAKSDSKHLNMESPPEAAAVAAADCSARTYSQVVFIDIPHSYPPSTPITCGYTLTEPYQAHHKDWVGIFKVGWSTAKDYHTFVWAKHSVDVTGQEPVTKQAIFKDYYLPKDEMEFYQFCYIDSAGQVRGASTPFCFKNPEEQSLENSPEDDLLVITTQEQVERSVHEKAELQKMLDQMRKENETLKSALQMEQQEVASLKGQNQQTEKEKSELVKELDQVKEKNGNLEGALKQQLQEINHLKMALQQQQSATEQTNQSQSLSLDGISNQNETRVREKYDRALTKINKLKEEGKELKEKNDVQSEEISKLNSRLKEAERELLKTKDSIQLLQVDLQSSEKEKERLSAELERLTHNMDEVKRENQELSRRLSQEIPPGTSDEDLKAQYKSLVSQLKDTQAKLAAEKDESRNVKTRAEHLDRDLMEIREQLVNVATSLDEERRKSSKYELQLREACAAIADKDTIIESNAHRIRLVKREKEETDRENQNLQSDIAGLRRALDASGDSTHVQPGDTSSNQDWQQQETPEQATNLYDSIGSSAVAEEDCLVCRHCQERFPGITQDELEQHEQCHRVCPFCTMICDTMEQAVFEDHVYSHEL